MKCISVSSLFLLVEIVQRHPMSVRVCTLLEFHYYSAPDWGTEYCDERVCLRLSVSVCVFVCP